MKHKILLMLAATICFVAAFSQSEPEVFTVVSYNVENLFDTNDNPDTQDDEFTPGGEKAWDSKRYQNKLKDLARVLSSLPGKDLPAIIGLAEVENLKVLEDLAASKGLKKGKYKIVHEEDRDPRGIECALLYRPDKFNYVSHELIEVVDPSDPEYILRGILHLEGKAVDGSNLHIYMNHWKSRRGGEVETRRKRMHAAISLRKSIDILRADGNDPRVIIMGDFNDEPTSMTVTSGLSAGNKRKTIALGDYYNLFHDAHNLRNEGSMAFQGRWNMLDQIIISYNLLNRDNGLSSTWDGGKIFREDWMLYESEKYGGKFPAATFGGSTYYGGVSDHLPVYVKFSY